MTKLHSVRAEYSRESSRIRKAFKATADGVTAASDRCALVDRVALALWKEITADDVGIASRICVAARGGYGRGALLPCSDVDLLFLSQDPGLLNRLKEPISLMCQQMWDLGLRVAPTVRTLAGCSEFDPENVELTLSLLELRHLAGDEQLFRQLYDDALPRLIRGNWSELVQTLVELTRHRHAKYGNTVFHLEPNVKECPGGLRDVNVASWLTVLLSVKKGGGLRRDCEPAAAHGDSIAFLMSTRCFLHYLYGRDDNTLRWEAQDAAAAKGIGLAGIPSENTAEWTRYFFRNARPISRRANQLLDEVSAERSSLYRQFLSWRSRVSNPDFAVVGGRAYFQESSAAADPDAVLRLFEFIAHHGFKLAADTQNRIERALPSLSFPVGSELWSRLRAVLVAHGAADALRDMHAVGILDALIPEFRLIDSLIIRDFYHRYTVDEHSFAAIDSLHSLQLAESETDRRYASLLSAIQEPELLYLALLLHDVGKGLPEGSHADASVKLAQAALARLGLSTEQRETVLFLIANHLEMSAAMRRDIFDRENTRAVARKIGSSERLKMLCLLTYADIRAVNPQALSSWKAEDLWHLYVGIFNELERSADNWAPEPVPQKKRTAVPAAKDTSRLGNAVEQFMAELPERYGRLHSAEQVALHHALAAKLEQDAVQLHLRPTNDLTELTLITRDRQSLFATLCGVLTAWNMDIVRANAFTSRSGMVVDTVSFRDRFRTIELNAAEKERFERSVKNVIQGVDDISALIESRIVTGHVMPTKVAVDTRVTFDNECSSHSTLLEIVAQDRPGLLYRIATSLSAHHCNINLALVDTEGQMAIDVFYITSGSGKLDGGLRNALRHALEEELDAKWTADAASIARARTNPEQAQQV